MVVKKKSKTPPIFSHEFVIQNHADILSCVLMVFIVTLYFQSTAKFGTLFITLNHNSTVNKTFEGHTYEDYSSFYTVGPKDYCFVFFYLITMIIYHAVIQEYILDKTNRKLHLSKTKTNKFNESGGLLAFFLPFLFYGMYIWMNGFIKSLNSLWEDYPTEILPWNVKLFFLLQIATWIHFVPELYFQKIPKEEWKERIIYILLYTIFVTVSYLLSFTKVALVLLLIQYFEHSIFHVARIIYFTGKAKTSKYGYFVWNVVFVVARLASIILLVLTFQFGLSKSSIPVIDINHNNFNTLLIRRNILAGFGFTQVWLMWNFLNFHLKRRREGIFNDAKSSPSKSTTKSVFSLFDNVLGRTLFASFGNSTRNTIASNYKTYSKNGSRSTGKSNAPGGLSNVAKAYSNVGVANGGSGSSFLSKNSPTTVTNRDTKKKKQDKEIFGEIHNPTTTRTTPAGSSKKKN